MRTEQRGESWSTSSSTHCTDVFTVGLRQRVDLLPLTVFVGGLLSCRPMAWQYSGREDDDPACTHVWC